MKNILSFSGGKDSTASVILAHQHNIDVKIVMAVLWFDKERKIPAINIDHWNFITKVIIPRFEKWGFEVELVNQKHSYIELFHHILKKPKIPERVGKKQGFVFAQGCYMTREKINAIKSIQKKYKDCQSIQGIAADETERLETLHKGNGISLLEEYGYTEQMALDLCKEYGLLSPIYKDRTRDGCWFCPNQKIYEWANLRENHPELWHELEIMSNSENLITNKIARNETLEDISKRIDIYLKNKKIKESQISIFDLERE